MNIRRATLEDVDGIARVHVESWLSTYKGLISEAYLSRITVEGRKRNWLPVFQEPEERHQTILVLEDEAGTIRGFISGGECREGDLPFDAEIYSIYLLEGCQKQGYGAALLHELTDILGSEGHRSVMAWVLEGNPALRFYQKVGGTVARRKQIRIGDETLWEIALGWELV